MTPSSMIERVARALYECWPEWDSGEAIDGHQVTPAGPIKWEAIVECGQGEPYREAARAAIMAMRTPDMNIVRQIAREIRESPMAVDLAYTRYIDAILSEHQAESSP